MMLQLYKKECKDVLNQAKENHGMIKGDLNTTLNPNLDRKNYKTDSHKNLGWSLITGLLKRK